MIFLFLILQAINFHAKSVCFFLSLEIYESVAPEKY